MTKYLEINTLSKPTIRKVWRADYPNSGDETVSWIIKIHANFSDDVRIEVIDDYLKEND